MASFQSSFISLFKTVVGAGLLSMPLAFATDGIIGGILLIILAAATAGYGLFLQAYVSKYVPSGHASFFNVCSITYPQLSVVFDIAIAVQCFGCAISYLVIIGDLMPTVIESIPNRLFWIICSGAICIPLCFLRNLDSLRYTSMLALGAIAYMSLLVVGHFVAGDIPGENRGPVDLWPSSPRAVFSTFSIIVFAFTGHQNMFSIINEARDSPLSVWTLLVNLVSGVAAGLFIIVGLSGYLTFGSYVAENVIMLYEPALSTTLARFSIVFMVVFSFPLMFHPARISFNNIYFWILVRTGRAIPELAAPVPDELAPLVPKLPPVVPFPNSTFYIMTTVLLAVAYAAAISIRSFALVLAIVGATGSTAISFILPGLFGYKLIEPDSSREKVLKMLSLALVVWGIVVMVVCLAAV